MIIEALNKLDRKFAWSLLGFALAFVFGGIGIYTEFIRDERPRVQFEILSDSSVLDVREDVGDLEVIYDGTDLRASGQSLRVVAIRVSNIGDDDILNSYYDANAPLGFSVLSGEIVRADVQSANESYLTDQLSIMISGPSEAVFSPVILAAGAFFTIRVLIIHQETERPAIEPIGKVARVSAITLVEASTPSPGSFWGQVFSGSIWVHVVRLGLYPAGAIILLIAVIWPTTSINDAIVKGRRKKKVGLFKKNAEVEFEETENDLFDSYIDIGPEYLHRVEAVLAEDQENLDALGRRFEEKQGTADDWTEDVHVIQMMRTNPEGMSPRRLYYWMAATTLFEDKVIENVDGHFIVNSRFKKTFLEFQNFLRLVGEG